MVQLEFSTVLTVQFLKSETGKISIRCPGFLNFVIVFVKQQYVLSSSSKILEINDLKIRGPHRYAALN